MPHSADIPIASIPTAVKLRVFSVMVYNAEYVLQEVVFYVRRCGIFFKSMPELVKNQNAMYHVAGD